MEFRHLRAFLTIQRVSRLTKAAQELHLSPSALSDQLRTMEAELGLSLFHRMPSGMLLSNAGKQLLPRVQAALGAVEEVRVEAERLRRQTPGSFRLLLNTDAAYLRVDSALTGLMTQEPHVVDIVLAKAHTPQVLKAVEEGQADAGFVFGPVSCPLLCVYHLGMQELAVVGPPSWREKLTAATWQQLSSLPWIWVTTDCAFHSLYCRIITQHCGHVGVGARLVVEDEDTLMSMVAAGAGLSLMRVDVARLAQERGKIWMREMEGLSLPLSFIHNRSTENDTVLCRIKKAVLSRWSEGVGSLGFDSNPRPV